VQALRLDQTELGHVTTKCVDQHRALADQQIPDSVHQERRLLLDRLYRHEAHRWTLDRLADRLSISRVVLVALDVGLHVLRWHEPHFMAQPGQLAGPVVCCRASFHADQTWWEAGKKTNNCAAAV